MSVQSVRSTIISGASVFLVTNKAPKSWILTCMYIKVFKDNIKDYIASQAIESNNIL